MKGIGALRTEPPPDMILVRDYEEWQQYYFRGGMGLGRPEIQLFTRGRRPVEYEESEYEENEECCPAILHPPTQETMAVEPAERELCGYTR